MGFTRLDGILVLTAVATFLAFAVPKHASDDEDSRVFVLKTDLERLRDAVDAYRRDHGANPGIRNEQISGQILVEQLTERTDLHGSLDSLGEFGPYLAAGVPFNPFNGSDAVWVAEDEELPQPDGRTGWVFHLASGELRANVGGSAGGKDEILFDL